MKFIDVDKIISLSYGCGYVKTTLDIDSIIKISVEFNNHKVQSKVNLSKGCLENIKNKNGKIYGLFTFNPERSAVVKYIHIDVAGIKKTIMGNGGIYLGHEIYSLPFSIELHYIKW